MDVQTAFYHGIRQNIRRVLVALGPERIEKGLTAFEDGASNWSDCFFARAFEGEADLSRTPSKFGKLPFARHHAMPTLYICDLLGDEKFDLRVAVAMVWHTFDQQSLFIDRNLQLLKPGGRLLIVVPDGILCNSGDAYIREYFMGMKDEESGEFLGGKAIVRAVVSLPTETFSIAGTGAKTSFIYLQKKRHAAEKQGSVFMAVAEHVGYLKKGKAEVPDPDGNDLVSIASSYIKGGPA